ncbi:pitrilysin family protein [Pseudomonas sp. EMN2]|uniref:M16 family metallopeptidase n=1 Tax=Pseudomonas sp. EMN2 TaxID=2615212 RepID=UPI00129B6B0E|nr:pitrilysin family protein [Pseudomonas sp. EMN2]
MPDAQHASFNPLQHFTLANGLRVYLREDHRAPLVNAQLWYHVGSSYEPEGHSGLSHALEHLMFEGSRKLAPGEYARLMTRLGGQPNAFTQKDATVFPLTLPAKRLEIALEAMADCMASATLDQAPFARELAVIMAERSERIDNNPLAFAWEKHTQLAYGKSTYATPEIGHHADLLQMTNAAVRTWYRTWYHPNNATLAVAGAIDLQQLHLLVERHFDAIPPNRLPDVKRPRMDVAPLQRSQALQQQGQRDGLLMSYEVPSLATADSPVQAHALNLLRYLLAVGNSSRMRRQMLDETQMAMAMGSDYSMVRRGDRLLSFLAYSNPEKATPEQLKDRLLAEVERCRHTPVDAAELARAKAKVLSQRVFEQDNIATRAEQIGQYASAGLDPALLDRERQAIENVTAEQIRQAAHDCLTHDRLTVTYMLGKESNHE